jgi:hypothetical protein
MDSRRFDSLTRSLASSGNRRAVLKGLLGLGGVALGGAGLHEAGAARRGYTGPPLFQPTPTPTPVCPPQSSTDCLGAADGCTCASGNGQCVQQTCRYPCPGGSGQCGDNPIVPATCCQSFGALGLFCVGGVHDQCTCESRKACEFIDQAFNVCCHDATSPTGGYCRDTFEGCDPFGE